MCCFATVSRSDICPRLARIASRINALWGSDASRIYELVQVVKKWQQATVLKYASPAHPWKTLGRGNRVEKDPRKRGKRAHRGSMSTGAAYGDAAYGGQSPAGKCRLGRVIGLMPPTSEGPCHIFRRKAAWAARYTHSVRWWITCCCQGIIMGPLRACVLAWRGC